MNKNIIKLTESQLHKVIKESVKNVLSEMNWKTYLNAAKGRKQQADELRDLYGNDFPNSLISTYRNSYDERSDDLENYAQSQFNKEYNDPILTHTSERDGWWDGEKAHLKHTRKATGIPHRDYGELYDETFDDAIGDGFTGNIHRKHATIINKDGAKYEPNLSTVGNEVSYSKSLKYNRLMDNMKDDMKNYYQGKSKYNKGKGWE